MNQPTTLYHNVTDNNNGRIGKLYIIDDVLYYYPSAAETAGGGDKVTGVEWMDISSGSDGLLFEESSLSFQISDRNGHKYSFQMKVLHDFQQIKQDLTDVGGQQLQPALPPANATTTTSSLTAAAAPPPPPPASLINPADSLAYGRTDATASNDILVDGRHPVISSTTAAGQRTGATATSTTPGRAQNILNKKSSRNKRSIVDIMTNDSGESLSGTKYDLIDEDEHEQEIIVEAEEIQPKEQEIIVEAGEIQTKTTAITAAAATTPAQRMEVYIDQDEQEQEIIVEAGEIQTKPTTTPARRKEVFIDEQEHEQEIIVEAGGIQTKPTTTTVGFSTTTSTSSSVSAANTTGTPSIQKLMEEIEMLKNRVKEAEKQIGIDSNFCVLPWRSIGQQKIDEEIGGQDDDGKFKLPKDVYSILATWNPKSKPFWTSMAVVFGMQMLLSGLLVYDSLRQADKENLLDLPANVEMEVRIAQGLAVIVAMICQDDLRVGIEGFFQGLPDRFKGREEFQGITKVQWHLAYMLRFIQGFMSLLASFILLMQADTVIELMLNFLGVAFISELDDRAFALGALGYLGNANLRCTQEISRAEFYRKKNPTSKRCSPTWFRHSMHLRVSVVLLAMIGGYLAFSMKQFEGTYSVTSFQVEFSDETVPYLGLFDGCYSTDNERDSARRFVYTAVSKSGSHTTGGKFAFCAKENIWTFYDGSSDHGDKCKDYILKSETTRTFDIIKAGNHQWYTAEDNPLELLKLKKVQQCTPSPLLLDSCERLELQGTLDESRSRFYDPIEPPETNNTWDPTLSHTIYVGAEFLEVVLFTGRRWVITNAEHLSSSTTITLTNKSDIKNFFFAKGKKLFHIKEQAKNWISYISEEVSSVQDRGTPRGLRWYNPRYEEATTSSSYNFPSADLSNPDDASFACAEATTFAIESVGCKDVTVRCNEKLYLQTNYDSDQCNQSHVELLHVPHGTSCRLTQLNPSDTANYGIDYGVAVYYGDTTKSTAVAIRKTQEQGGEVTWDVPTSQCLTDVLSNITVDIFNRTSAAGVALSRLAADGFSEYQCTIDTDFVKERYVLALLNQSVPFIPMPWDAHQCQSFYKYNSEVRCNKNKRISYIAATDFSSKGGTIPSELANLEELNHLNLRSNELIGEIPIELGNLAELTSLNLRSNDLTGPITSELGNLAGLIRLRLYSNHLTGTIPKELSNLTALRLLYLSSNDLKGTIPNELGKLTALTELYLQSNNLIGTIPKDLGNLEALQYLYLNSNDLHGTMPNELGKLTALTELCLHSNNLSGTIPSELSSLAKLDPICGEHPRRRVGLGA